MNQYSLSNYKIRPNFLLLCIFEASPDVIMSAKMLKSTRQFFQALLQFQRLDQICTEHHQIRELNFD